MAIARVLCIFFFWAGLTSLNAEVVPMPLTQIWHYGDALNIEGGLIPARQLNREQIWGNLCFILDRPFNDGIELKEISKKNSYPLKEANILAFNERKAALATALVLKYYITEGRHIAATKEGEAARVVVQVHRNSTGPAHLLFLQNLIELMKLQQEEQKKTEHGLLLTFPQHQVTLELRSGVRSAPFENAHIVLSVSVAAGLHPLWESGTILLPNRFTPFDIHSMALMPEISYEVENHLIEALDSILAKQEIKLLAAINERISSPNPAKALQQTEPLVKEDFHKASLLQVNGLFNPTELPESLALFRD